MLSIIISLASKAFGALLVVFKLLMKMVITLLKALFNLFKTLFTKLKENTAGKKKEAK